MSVCVLTQVIDILFMSFMLDCIEIQPTKNSVRFVSKLQKSINKVTKHMVPNVT